MGFSRLTIFGCLTIAVFESYLTTTIFDTKQPSLTEKSTENEGLSPVTTRWLRGWDLKGPTFDIVILIGTNGLSILLISRFSTFSLHPPPAALVGFVPRPPGYERFQENLT